MAETSIEVCKKTVLGLLKEEVPFVIPEYQRPYSWKEEEIETFFEDIWSFSEERLEKGKDCKDNYFFGSIVYFKNEGKTGESREIIDGQQRIVSLYLLLRTIEMELEKIVPTSPYYEKAKKNFIDTISSVFWMKDQMTNEPTEIKLRSMVISEEDKNTLNEILVTGEADSHKKDNYSVNYNNFVKLYEAKAEEYKEREEDWEEQVFQFVNSLLNYCILLPVSTNDRETALTIFTTLNNRGMPLSDADIFRSIIYKQQKGEKKLLFAKAWKDFEKEASDCGEDAQKLFTYHMYYQMAEEGITNTSVVGLRKYYMDEDKNRLSIETFNCMVESLNLWRVINKHEELPNESWSRNMPILKTLDTLTSYPNDFWKYPVLIFYICHHKKEGFAVAFGNFLRELIGILVPRYLTNKPIATIKGSIIKLDAEVYRTMTPDYKKLIRKGSAEYNLKSEFTKPRPKIMGMLLKMVAYSNVNQNKLLPDDLSIEYITPKDMGGDETIEIGNILLLENGLSASKAQKMADGYFEEKKKVIYECSIIAMVNQIGKMNIKEWRKSEINNRTKDICNILDSIILRKIAYNI